jgi:hypothetical protein
MKATTITRKKGKTFKSFTPVNFSATYSQSNNSVTLKIIGKSPFAKGGQISILTVPPSGVSSQLDVPLNSSDTFFEITPNAKKITLA